MIALLQQVLFPKDNTSIKAAEAQIVEYKKQHPGQFLTELIIILADEQSKPQIRQGAGVLFKTAAVEKVSQSQFYIPALSIIWSILQEAINPSNPLWVRLTQQIRDDIKNKLLMTLMTTNPLAKRAAADAIAVISSIELPLGQWPEIINILVNNSKHTELEVRLAAILTLGFMCEQFKQLKPEMINVQQAESILLGIIMGIKQNTGEIRDISLKALRDSLQFMTPLMQSKQHRDLLCSRILEIISQPNVEANTRLVALQALVQFVKLNYANLDVYITYVFTATSAYIQDKTHPELAKLAMEVWDSISTEFFELKDSATSKLTNYLQGELLLSLVKMLLENLTIVDNDEDDEQNTMRAAAFRTLTSIGMISANEMSYLVTDFVSRTITHSQWKFRQAGLKAFCCLLEGMEENRMKEAITNVLIEFLRLLNDNSSYVQQSAGFCLAKISEFFPESIMDNAKFNEILEHLLTHLPKKPAISIQICKIIQNFAIEAENKKNAVFKQHIDKILGSFIENGLREVDRTELNLLTNSFITTITVISACHEPSINLKYLTLTLSAFPNTFSKGARTETIQCGLLTVIHSLLLALSGTQLDSSIAQQCYMIIESLFRHHNDVTSDGLYVLGALATHLPNNITYLEKCWPFIEHSLSKTNESELFRAALGAIMDVARAAGDAFKPKIAIMDKLLDAIQLPEFDRMIKLSIFTCVGDIYLSCSECVLPYVAKTMGVFSIAYQGAIILSETDFEYAQQLKEALIQATTCVLHGVSGDDRKNPDFAERIDSIFEFVRLSCTMKMRPTVEYVKQGLLLLMDICKFYPQQTVGKAKSPFIIELVEIIKKHNKKQEYEHVISYCRQIMGL